MEPYEYEGPASPTPRKPKPKRRRGIVDALRALLNPDDDGRPRATGKFDRAGERAAVDRVGEAMRPTTSADLGVETDFTPIKRPPTDFREDIAREVGQGVRVDATATRAKPSGIKATARPAEVPYRDPMGVAQTRGELQRIAEGRKAARDDGTPYTPDEREYARTLDQNLRARIDREEAKGGDARRALSGFTFGGVNAPLQRDINDARREGNLVAEEDLRALDVTTRDDKTIRTEPTFREGLREEVGGMAGELPWYLVGPVSAEGRLLAKAGEALATRGTRARSIGEAISRVGRDEITSPTVLGRAGQRTLRGAVQGAPTGAAISVARRANEGESAEEIAAALPLETAIGSAAGAVIDPVAGAAFDVARGAARAARRVRRPGTMLDAEIERRGMEIGAARPDNAPMPEPREVEMETLADAIRVAREMETAPPREQANAVRQMEAARALETYEQIVGREQRSADMEIPLGQATAEVRERATAAEPEPLAVEYRDAIDRYVSADLALKDAEQTGKVSDKLRVAAARAKDALNIARKRYGQEAGAVAIAALAAQNDDLTDEEKGVVGLAGLALGTAKSVPYVPARTRRTVVEQFLKSPQVERLGGPEAHQTVREWFGVVNGTNLGYRHAEHIKKAVEAKLGEKFPNHRPADLYDVQVTAQEFADAIRTLDEREAEVQKSLPPLRSRLRDFINAAPADNKRALGKKWDEPTPAARWIEQLQAEMGKGAFRKDEFDLVLPALKAAKEAGTKFTRTEINALLDEHLPKIERVVLQEPPTRNAPDPETILTRDNYNEDVQRNTVGILVDGTPMRADTFNAVFTGHEAVEPMQSVDVNDPIAVLRQMRALSRESTRISDRLYNLRNRIPEFKVYEPEAWKDDVRTLDEQIDARERKITQVEDRHENAISDARERADDREYSRNNARDNVASLLREYSVRGEVREQFLAALEAGERFNTLREMLHGEVTFEVEPYIDPVDLLNNNNIRVRARRPDWVFVIEENGAKREVGRYPYQDGDTPSSVAARFVEQRRQQRRSWRNVALDERDDNAREWVLVDENDGEEIASGADKNSLMWDYIREKELDQAINDAAYEEAESEFYSRVESRVDDYKEQQERFEEAQTELADEKKSAEEAQTQIAAWKEEVEHLTALLDDARERGVQPIGEDPAEVAQRELDQSRANWTAMDEAFTALKKKALERWRELRAAAEAEGAEFKPPVGRGSAHYFGTQTIGGSPSEYREVLNVLANAKGRSNPGDHMAQYGYEDVIGWTRQERHPRSVVPRAELLAKAKGDEATAEAAAYHDQIVSWEKRLAELDAARVPVDEALDKLPAKDLNPHNMTPEASDLVAKWKRNYNDRASAIKNLEAAEQSLAGLLGFKTADEMWDVLAENQSDTAQHMANQGKRAPVSPEETAAALKKLQDAEAEYRRVDAEYNRINSEHRAATRPWDAIINNLLADTSPIDKVKAQDFLTKFHPIAIEDWGERAYQYVHHYWPTARSLGNIANANEGVNLKMREWLEANLPPEAIEVMRAAALAQQRSMDADNARQAARQAYNAASQEKAALDDRQYSGIDPNPFVTGGDVYDKETQRWNASGDLAYKLNAGIALADAVARTKPGEGLNFAWSDAPNRFRFASFRVKAAKKIYGAVDPKKGVVGMIPSAITDALTAAGIKGVKIEHVDIEGHGHWGIRLTPEQVIALRRFGVYTMGLMLLLGSTAEAQDPTKAAEEDKDIEKWVKAGVGGAVITASLWWLARSRAARLNVSQNPKLRAAHKTAIRLAHKFNLRPDFAFQRREPMGRVFDAPIDVAETPTGKGPALFNVAKMGLTPEGETVWRRIVEELRLKKRYVSWDETIAEAERRVPTIEDLLHERPWQGTDALAARMFQSQASQRLAELARELPTGTPDEQALVRAEMDRVAVDIADIAARAAGERERAGRTLNTYKIIARHNMDEATWQTLGQRAKADIPLTTDEILKIRSLTSRNDREGLTAFISSLHTSTPLDKWLTFWKAGMLTGLGTHAINMISNAAEAGLQMASQPSAVAIDALLALTRGTVREKALPRGWLTARLKGMKQGGKEALQVLKTGVHPDEIGKWDVRQTNYKSPILQAYTQGVFRLLGASDRVFYNVALEGALDEITTLVAQRAVRSLPKGTLKFDDVYNALRADPPNEIAARAAEEATRAVFQNNGTLARMIGSVMKTVRDKGGTARLATETVIPFTRTPANIASRFVDTTPLGFVTAILRQVDDEGFDQRRFSEDVARALTGTGGLMLLGYWLAERGEATGSAPTDASRREVWRTGGKRAHSIKLGNRWYSAARVGPMGMTIAAGAQLHAMMNEHADKEGADKAFAIAMGMTGTVGKVMLDQSFLLGVSRALETISDPLRQGESFVSGAAASLIPAVVGRGAQSADPVEREAEGPAERVQSRVPFASRNLRPALNAFGEPMERTTTDRAIAPVDPFFSSRVRGDEGTQSILSELERLRVGLPRLPKHRSLTDTRTGESFRVSYTDEERHDALANDIGPRRRALLERLMFSDNYAAMPDQVREREIRKMLDAALEPYYARDDRRRISERRAAAPPQP